MWVQGQYSKMGDKCVASVVVLVEEERRVNECLLCV